MPEQQQHKTKEWKWIVSNYPLKDSPSMKEKTHKNVKENKTTNMSSSSLCSIYLPHISVFENQNQTELNCIYVVPFGAVQIDKSGSVGFTCVGK